MTQQSESGYMKKATAYQFVFLSLVIGFLGGIVFSVYKLDTTTSSQSHQHGPVANQNGNMQNSQKMLALEKEVQTNPDNIAAWRELGNLYFDEHKHSRAIQAYEKYLELSPDDPNVLTDLGVMYRRSGQPQKAIEIFDQAIKADPGHTQAMFNKGVVLYADLNDKGKAVQTWQEVVSINPAAKAPNGMPVSEVIKSVMQE